MPKSQIVDQVVTQFLLDIEKKTEIPKSIFEALSAAAGKGSLGDAKVISAIRAIAQESK